MAEIIYFGADDRRVQTGTRFPDVSASKRTADPWPVIDSLEGAALISASSITNISSPDGPDPASSDGGAWVVGSGRVTGLLIVTLALDRRRCFRFGPGGESFGDSLGAPDLAARITGWGMSCSANHSPWFCTARSNILV